MAQENVFEKLSVEVPDADPELVALVDEIGGMAEKVAEAKKVIDHYNQIRKQIVELGAQHVSPEDATQIVGNEFVVNLTAQAKSAEVVNKAAIFEAVGNDTFVELANFSITDLRKYLNPVEFDKAVATVHAGARRLTVVKKD